MQQQLDLRKLLGVHEDERTVLAIGSGNPHKVKAVMEAFESMSCGKIEEFWVENATVPSGVPEQPVGYETTFRGAEKRLEEIKRLIPNAHIWVSIEAGLIEMGKGHYGNVQACVISLKDGRESRAMSAAYMVPDKWCEVAIKEDGGMAKVFEKRFGLNKGGTRPLTGNQVSRKQLIEEAVKMAIYGLNW